MSCFPCFTSKVKKTNSKDANSRSSSESPPHGVYLTFMQCFVRIIDLAKARNRNETPKADGGPNINVKAFTFWELASATKNFRQECLLGEGAFGRVYKGQLENSGQDVAVKQLDRNGLHGNKEFLQEVSMLSLLDHENLVNLVGYCADGEQRLLVCEYMSLGSLVDHLFEMKPDQEPLSWPTRMNLALGAARGVEYLHEKANPPVLYRDLKSSNILLCGDFHPKLSTFGLGKAKSVGDKMQVSRVMGTYGYCAPEYSRDSQFTLKSDIYSFGVVLLELITGRKAIDTTRPMDEQNLVSWAQPKFRDPKKFPEMADPLLKRRFPEKSLNQAVAIAAMCLQEEASVRPLISDVVTTLSFLVASKEENIVQHLIRRALLIELRMMHPIESTCPYKPDENRGTRRSIDSPRMWRNLGSPKQSTQLTTRRDSMATNRIEPITSPLSSTIDRTSSIRKTMSLSIKHPPTPPPLCSVCKHNAPIFGKAPRKFDYKEIIKATDGFSRQNFLAEGGYGAVYRGVLPDGQVVAVKQHKMLSAQGASEFCSEVEVLRCAQHRNLVMLVGYCVEVKWILVYEFACNGSLDKHLYGELKQHLMSWDSRMKVALGAARGLRYLHEDCRVGCIVHRDFRPTNILLTHDFEPMVGDFGLARWQADGQTAEETRVIGAFGYLAPEYTQTGLITEKADVYAFGVVLLELLSGCKATELSRHLGQQLLLDWASLIPYPQLFLASEKNIRVLSAEKG
ncbi:unnamed protein product, partial [Vitis vinifera]